MGCIYKRLMQSVTLLTKEDNRKSQCSYYFQGLAQRHLPSQYRNQKNPGKCSHQKKPMFLVWKSIAGVGTWESLS